ncbi:MAG: M48 family metallopeptidase [Candidatus Yonathbacteria bacterium]|nr:M48 family metallopeptidase [Candidatus Yonathbacteria bacterium]NTW47384.1 M48 family metallopeptidase [Candidatus Yonathbacteria bacterium]
MFTFVFVVIAIGWAASWYFNDPLILTGFVLFSIVMNVSSFWFSDKIVLSTAGAHEADPVTYLELHRIVENLAITAGLPKPRVYIVNDPSPNAFATGRNPEHGVVAVTTGLLSLLDRSELEGVVAHELSHIGNRDTLIATVAAILVGFVALISDVLLRAHLWGGGDDDHGDGRIRIIMMLVGFALALLAPIFARLLQLAISRKREFLADASGALLTRYPDGLASALQKISGAAVPLRHANQATAHLYIENPFSRHGKVSGMASLFMTHPPVEARIAALLGNNKEETV